MNQNRRRYDQYPLQRWWQQTSMLFKILMTVLPATFCAGVIYATLTATVSAHGLRLDALEAKQSADHEALTRVDQGVSDLKLYFNVPSYHGVK